MTTAGDGKAAILAAAVEATGNGEAARLVPLLFARPPEEDLAAFSAAELALLAERASAALSRHRPAGQIVEVARPQGLTRAGLPLAVATIVNDDRPFLFDSVLAEIGARSGAVLLIAHPVLAVSRGADGRPDGFGRGTGEAGISLIQVVFEPEPGAESDAALPAALERILRQIASAVGDFEAMKAKVREAVATLDARAAAATGGAGGAGAEIAEAARLLDWLLADNFIFLGMRELDYVGEGEEASLERRDEPGLGILSDPGVYVLGRAEAPVHTTPEIRAFLTAPAPLIVTKANSRSLVHRRAYLDYIGVKRYDEAGAFVGELRIVGLFTSSAYTRSVLTIPYLRRKAETVIARFGLASHSHSGKALLNVLESYPRDELFQIGLPRLEAFVGIVLDLGERPRVRVLPRIDRFDRFVSILVFVPKDRYDTRLSERIGLILAAAYDGHVSAVYPAFPEGQLARIHFIVGRRGGQTPDPDVAPIEAEIAALAQGWEDAFLRAVHAGGAGAATAAFAPGLPESYRDLVDPAEAVTDVGHIAVLDAAAPLAIDFYRRPGDEAGLLRLKIYHFGEAVPLSTRVPILENMGFSVVSERTFELTRPDGAAVHLHDMDLTRRAGGSISLPDGGRALEAAFIAVSAGRVENDGINALVLEAGLSVREANVLRAYSRYLRQTGLAFAQDYLAATLLKHGGIARDLFALFAASFDPATAEARDTVNGSETPAPSDGSQDRALAIAAERGALAPYRRLLEALDKVESLDEDRVLRRFLNLVLATLRTNFYAVDGLSADPASQPGRVEPALAFKFDPHLVEGLPAPIPFREIFVFDARVEGVHLRFGRVARGGIRWSDRSQDYRTEILGLVKAQQVKNAVIVPVGAKGGFLPKRLPDPGSRDAFFEAGRSAYVVFIASLLSITDDIGGADIRAPENVVRFDGDDPYFVVAADKGTATFSDTANAIAVAHRFWLDDAFASGGSAGYDHKAMGITARGAWEAVKRHFRELGREGCALDIQEQAFTAVGCGDMSGDVFGNGMLLSRQTRLVAAFDHRDIFIDPAPDTQATYAERRRLFDLPRSSWADFDRSLLSKGGGVFSRREKLVRLSPEAAAAIGWDRTSGTPADVITAILKAPVDLLFFGGIGTYIRASTETNADVGDRANDALRITGREVRAKVIGEGANLGATQRGRIEAARAGVRLNTDAIDNSAGVNTSDVEVNIKIALKSAMAAGRLARADRDVLLKSMTEEVGHLVLANNYEQTLALSLEAQRGAAALPLQGRFMTVLGEARLLDREVEVLPGDAALADLRASGRGLSRPEVAVVLAYAKIVLFDQLVAGSLPDEPYLEDRLFGYFPSAMRAGFAEEIRAHRLRREIVATLLANQAINRLGPTVVTAIREATGASPAAVAGAFVIAHDGFDTGALYRRIDALDGQVPGETQNDLYEALGLFLQVTTRWFTTGNRASLAEEVAALRGTTQRLRPLLLGLASPAARDAAEARGRRFTEAGVPDDIARDVALLPLLALVPDIAFVSRETGAPIERTMSAYFAMTALFEIGELEGAILRLQPSDYYELLALERAASLIGAARRRLTAAALSGNPEADDPVAAWAADRGDTLARLKPQIAALAGSGETSVARLTVAAGLLSDLAV